jgi:hypothetical protein
MDLPWISGAVLILVLVSIFPKLKSKIPGKIKDKFRFLHKPLSDWIIVFPFLFLWCFGATWLFYSDAVFSHRSFLQTLGVMAGSYPMIFSAVYLGLKALTVDIYRIVKKVSIPGLTVYVVYAAQWFLQWFTLDFLWGLNHEYHAVSPFPIYYSWEGDNFIRIWIIVDVVLFFLTLLVSKLEIFREPVKNRLLLGAVGSYVTFILVGFIAAYSGM